MNRVIKAATWPVRKIASRLQRDRVISQLKSQGPAFVLDFTPEGTAELVVSPRFGDNRGYVAVGDRPYEYAFVVEKFVHMNIVGRTVLDVGSSGSVLPPILASLGNRIIAIDVREWPIQWPNLEVHTIDILAQRRLPPVDVITCISTAEHIGLGRYGDKLDPQGDLKALRELRESLKPKGLLILTVPYGRPAVVFPAHRVYDAGRFSRLTQGFTVLDQRFYAPLRRSDVLEPCEEEDTLAVDVRFWPAITCCLLQKEGEL